MEQIKQQIYSHVTNNQVRQYLQRNVFNNQTIPSFQLMFTQTIFKRQNQKPYKHNLQPMDSKINTKKINNQQQFYNPSSQSVVIVPTIYEKNVKLLQQQTQKDHNIKQLLNKIQGSVIMNGFARTIQDINQLKQQIHQIRQKNKQLELNLAKIKNKKNQSNTFTYLSQKSKIKEQIFRQSMPQCIEFDRQLQSTEQKLSYERTKQSLISIVKLSKQSKQALLANTNKQYQSMLRHINTIQKVIENIQAMHPDEAALKLQVEELERQVSEKRMLLDGGQRLDGQIEKLKLQISIWKKQHPNLQLLIRNKSSMNHQKLQNNQKLQIQKQQLQQKQALRSRLSNIEEFLKEEQIQKQLLIKDISDFNEHFNQQKQKNRLMLNKIQQNFYQHPQLIDEVLKIHNQDHDKVKFLLDHMGLSFQ